MSIYLAKPYNLSAEQIQWVEDTLAGMSDEEKSGQLFTNLFHFGKDTFSGDDLTSQQILDKYHIGGARYSGGKAKQVQALLNSYRRIRRFPCWSQPTAIPAATVHVLMAPTSPQAPRRGPA